MCSWFWYFGYDIRIYANLKADDIRNTITKLTKTTTAENNEKIFPKYTSLVFCILSHGDSGKVHGVDGLTVNIYDDLYSPLKKEVNESTEKPELLFIIQADQGTDHHPPDQLSASSKLEDSDQDMKRDPIDGIH